MNLEKLSRIKAACQRLIELDAKATPAPWKKSFTSDEKQAFIGPMEADYDDVDHEEVGANMDLVALSRTLTPSLAKWVLDEIEWLESDSYSVPFQQRLTSLIDSFPDDV